jgi:hypothetical protein
MPHLPPRKCTHLTRKGEPCRAWAVRGSEPAACSAHGGRTPGRVAHSGVLLGGEPAEPDGDGIVDAALITGVIRDLAAKQQRLSEYIDRCLAGDLLSPSDMARLLALHGLNASRLGRLLRDQRDLGVADDLFTEAMNQALDGLSAEWGIEL